ncbi:MAG: tyrosine-type recombinase/integrase [Deltaproteobacteria bacterium]|nr:tyrosine-type recombinase/integrase [Deltaproteobacteria bacterium]
MFSLLSGCRVGEAESLAWQDVDLEALDNDGQPVGEITLKASVTKTKRYRTIGLEVASTLRTLLAAMKLRAGSDSYVFGGKAPLSHTRVEAARKRLLRDYGAPKFSWQNLRQTCGTFLTNAPGIYGAASVFMSARQLGHSVTVAERYYLGVVRGIPREARTLETAMQIEDLAQRIISETLPQKLGIKRDTVGQDKT